jgi:drug/metabolite transporter (DMT)-like permease
MHKVTGRWQLGFLLAFITALMWGVLPIFLKILLERMDAYTITWYRFLIASLLLSVHLLRKRRIPSLKGISRNRWILLIIATLGLTGNYVVYLLGLTRVTPETAQMVVQLAPMFLLLGGLFFFGEPFRLQQWVGLALLIAGLLLFFNRHLGDFGGAGSGYYAGVALIVVSAAIWAAYGLAQKGLLTAFRSDELLLIIYCAAVLILLPPAKFGELLELNTAQLLLLAFCCINTVIAYGSFAEAMVHWEASRVSAVLATTPLITLAAIWLLADLTPAAVAPEKLNSLAIAGAFLAVAGSMLAALGSQQNTN